MRPETISDHRSDMPVSQEQNVLREFTVDTRGEDAEIALVGVSRRNAWLEGSARGRCEIALVWIAGQTRGS
jgi:hypothetical protein